MGHGKNSKRSPSSYADRHRFPASRNDVEIDNRISPFAGDDVIRSAQQPDLTHGGGSNGGVGRMLPAGGEGRRMLSQAMREDGRTFPMTHRESDRFYRPAAAATPPAAVAAPPAADDEGIEREDNGEPAADVTGQAMLDEFMTYLLLKGSSMLATSIRHVCHVCRPAA